ncbi:tellurite resistance methyltransferase TehB [Ignatzschineria ureiclastica]|uniref:Tellurite resistance methyltransferase TehB n=2 Tax=Ignatzschineria TaxID=112008 RepID=A0A2U2AGL0_9GAMM|nr:MULTISPECIES: tellurite resistance methyltransferase TehB [Ignatzschineria]PWD81791.1 tellurite resistance methyltransferase TehB [Ignatzschineria ureiclastica]GGZ90554.1 hypothetical protein GCM10007162_01800 [Ignatzschineria ureiclastica]
MTNDKLATESTAKPKEYYHEQYGLTLPHSDVVSLVEQYQIAPCKTLDLGCGQGRNSLYLAERGFELTSVDLNQMSIDGLIEIAAKEGLRNIQAQAYDINQAAISERYDLIISTVVLMFVQQDRIEAIIENMQAQTNVGGYNLIVSAMSTAAYPFDGFPCTFAEGQLSGLYQDWKMLHYDENVGELHRLDADGNRMKLQFATILAQKVA